MPDNELLYTPLEYPSLCSVVVQAEKNRRTRVDSRGG